MNTISNLKIKIYADGADRNSMIEMYHKPYISGLTTNPTLMKKAGIKNYESFAKDILTEVKDKPISFEVFSDEFDEMERQALKIASWGTNVFVKLPVTNTKKQSACPLIKKLSNEGVQLNVTALMTESQAIAVYKSMNPAVSGFISVFAGRIADTGVDPVPMMSRVVELLSDAPKIELIWASPRELLNVIQAEKIGCDVITMTTTLLNKLGMIGYDLSEYSLDTVKMFHADARESEFIL